MKFKPRFEQAEAPLVERDIDRAEEDLLAKLWLVVIHNDDVTPYDYVVRLLIRIFLLSHELAEHVAATVHADGRAIVVVRPKAEAEQFVVVAIGHARQDGYPLHFTAEPES